MVCLLTCSKDWNLSKCFVLLLLQHRREKVSLTVRGPKICKFIDYVIKFKNFRVTLSLQIYCMKSVGTGPHDPHGNPPMVA